MGQRDIRRLLIIGAMTVVRCVACKGAPAGSWLDRMISRKPKMLVAMALANKMARMIWAMMTKMESYRAADGSGRLSEQLPADDVGMRAGQRG